MSITDELREWAHGFNGPWKRNEEMLLAIADRIDEEHGAQLRDAFETRNSEENLAADGWVHLPVDDDGEVVYIGSLCKVYPFSAPAKKVRALRVSDFGWFVIFEDGSEEQRYRVRVYKPPTTEDVLREFVTEFNRDDTELCDDEVIERFAKRLQLKEVDE